MQHQDIEPSLGAGQFYNFIFYPFSTSKASGGIKLVPFSHIQNNLTLGEPYGSLEDEIELFPEAGDLLIVDGCCFHSVPKNTSNEDRYSIVYLFYFKMRASVFESCH